MLGFLDRYTDYTYALLRIVAGFLFIFHGAQKLFGFPGGAPEGIPDFIIYIAGPIELVGGILIMIGLFTREAAFLSAGLMAAAYFMAHATSALFPILNRGELAIMFCFVYLYIACTGSGIWSIDSMREGSSVDSGEGDSA
ncbi:MAG: DoxX family protein [Gammaproteobacteria bacterium]|nr:DoxX family protein [Gammaproteobacteria bacterium]